MDENMNMTEMVNEQTAADTVVTDNANGTNVTEAIVTTTVIAAAGYGIGKLIEIGVKKLKNWWSNRKKAAVEEEAPVETAEVESVE